MRSVAMALTLCSAAALAAGNPEVSFRQPRNGATALGETKIEVDVFVPPGATVGRVELRLDGRTLAILTAPPWIASWNAGEGERGHALDALLVLADGRQARASVRTTPLRIDHVERVDLVDLFVTVRDARGSYVTDLGAEDFKVFENEVPQQIERFSNTQQPLRLALVLDTSKSMTDGNKFERARAAAIDFLDVLSPTDQGLIIGFSDEVRVLHELSSDRAALTQALRAAEAFGGTALYDAIWRSSERLRGFEGRRVVVLLSDGRDEAANGLEPGSLHTLDEAIDQALKSEAIVFALGVGRDLDREYAMRWGPTGGRSNLDTDRSLASILQYLTESTGGRLVLTASGEKIQRAFNQFAADLRHQYSFSFKSTDRARDGKWRKLRVETPGRELTVISRRGYYAPEPGS